MPELAFQIRGAEALRGAVSPGVALFLEITSAPATQEIHTVLLNCQIQIEAARRRYEGGEQALLRDVFGEPERWRDTLRSLHWANLTTTVPGFTKAVAMKLIIPCTFDFTVTSTKFFHALGGGTIPITLLFSGTIFYRNDSGQLQACPIPWNTEARFIMPAEVWREAIELHYPNTSWLALRRDTFERLYDFKVRLGLATFDEAIERIMTNTLEAGA